MFRIAMELQVTTLSLHQQNRNANKTQCSAAATETTRCDEINRSRHLERGSDTSSRNMHAQCSDTHTNNTRCRHSGWKATH